MATLGEIKLGLLDLVTKVDQLIEEEKNRTPTPAPTPTPPPVITPTPTPPVVTPPPTPLPTPINFPGASAANRDTWNGKLFAPDSPWNTPIPANTLIDPQSDKYLGPGSQWAIDLAAHGFDINCNNWYGVPLYYADPSTPRVTLCARYSWSKAGGVAIGGVVAQMPLPPEYVPDTGTDKHVSVWDVANNLLHECWELKLENGKWVVGFYMTFRADGSGYQDGKWLNGPRAYGGSLAAGAIRYGEMKAGKIEHALAISHPHTPNPYARGVGPGGVLAIASHSDNHNYAPAGMLCIPEGARLRLKASVDVEARAPTLAGKIIGRTLKIWGAICADHAGVHVAYTENSAGHSGMSWNGVVTTQDMRWIKSDDWELCALPALTNPS